MGLKVSGKIVIPITKEVDDQTYELKHIFKKNALTKQGLKLLGAMLSSGCMDDEGNVTKDTAKLAEAGLEPMIELYDACIERTEGYEVEDGSSPVDYVDLGDKIDIAGKLVSIVMGRIGKDAEKNSPDAPGKGSSGSGRNARAGKTAKR